MLRGRLQALAAQPGPAAVLLGDSVCYGSALRERGDRDWRRHSPAAALREELGGLGWRLHSFAADGLQPLDLEALHAAAAALSPQAEVIELNVRMLAAAAGESPTAMVQPWLAPWLDPAARPAAGGLAEAAGEALRRGWATWRWTETLAWRLLQPSLRQRLEPWADAVFPARAAGEEEADARQALLDLKLRPYYQAPAPAEGHLGWSSLRRLAAALRASPRPCLVFLTPQNLERVGPLLDEGNFQAQRRELARVFAPGGGLRYADWSGRRPEGAFLDHCHLDEAGNRGLARWIREELQRGL